MSVHKKILDQNKLLLPKKAEESSKWFEQKIKGISTTKPTKNMGNNLVMFNYFPGRGSKKTRYSVSYRYVERRFTWNKPSYVISNT